MTLAWGSTSPNQTFQRVAGSYIRQHWFNPDRVNKGKRMNQIGAKDDGVFVDHDQI